MQEGNRAMEPIGRQLDAARRGESEALSNLYRQFLPGVFGYIATRVPDRATAEDLTSEVFLKMIEGIARLRARDEASFAAWLLQIARMTVAGYYRKREGVPGIVSLNAQDAEGGAEGGMLEHELTLAGIYLGMDPADLVETRDEWHTVVDAINALTEEQRQVLVGRLFLGYNVETVARLIGKKANAVKALQFRALHSLHRLLGRRGYPEQVPSMQTRHRGGK